MSSKIFNNINAKKINRRAFLAASAAFFAACSENKLIDASSVLDTVNFKVNPFRLGVASGDPYHDSVVIWTRLAPKPLTKNGGMPNQYVKINWRVSTSADMASIVQSGVTVATPAMAHSAHIEVEGLRADTRYWYQFEAAGFESAVGRTKTVPAIGTNVKKLNFAFACCQHFESGYYNAYTHMAKEDLDLVVFLGDYIYESPLRGKKQVRTHLSKWEMWGLSSYRIRYAEYKLDPDLQTIHAMAPWLLTHDDHEVDNNYAGLISQDKNLSEEQFGHRREAAYKAYFEHMPFRWSMKPDSQGMQLYRKIDYGNLARFYMLDTRQYRSNQPCNDGVKPLCGEVFSESATILGEQQEQWLFDNLLASRAQWNVLAQQVMMAPVDRIKGPDIGVSMDTWAGYEVNRKKMITFLADNQIRNPVVLTGDVHSNWINQLKVDYDDLFSNVVATEFVATSISSGGDDWRIKQHKVDQFIQENDFVEFCNFQRGYVYCEVTATQWVTEFKVLDYVTRRGSPISVAKRHVLPSK